MAAPNDDQGGFHPLAAANELIAIAKASNPQGVDNLTLQKELFIAHGLALATVGLPLVKGGFEAWTYGPVSPPVYHHAKHHGYWKINEPISLHRLDDDPESGCRLGTDHAHTLLQDVWDAYKDWTPFQLVDATHRHGTPWFQVTNGGEKIGDHIPDELIKAYYSARVRR